MACEISTGDELLLTELIFSGAFNNLSVEQATALLSCFVFQEKVETLSLSLSPSLSLSLSLSPSPSLPALQVMLPFDYYKTCTVYLHVSLHHSYTIPKVSLSKRLLDLCMHVYNYMYMYSYVACMHVYNYMYVYSYVACMHVYNYMYVYTM